MDQQVSVSILILSVITSFVGSLLFFWFLKNREKRIKTKIAEIDLESQFLDKIKKGNIQLIRSGFRTVFFSLFLIFSSGAAMLSTSNSR